MRHTLRIALSELIYYKWTVFLLLVLYFMIQPLLSLITDGHDYSFAVPQIIMLIPAFLITREFREKRALVFALLPVSRGAVLQARLIMSGLVWLALVVIFAFGQWITAPQMNTDLLLQTAGISGLTVISLSTWLLLLEMNFHAWRLLWKLPAVVALFTILLVAMVLVIKMSFTSTGAFGDWLYRNAFWVLISEHVWGVVISAIASVLFLQRESFTGKTTTNFFGYCRQDNT